MSLSNRCLKGLETENGPMELTIIYFSDPFHEENNPQGYIRLSCAANNLCKEILLQKFQSIKWSNFDGEEILNYTVPGGQYSTRKVFANLMNEFMPSDIRYPIKPEEILVISGATMICDLLSHVLFDEGGILLTHSPFYHRFLNDFSDRGLIEVVAVPTILEGSIEAELKVEIYEKAYQKAISEGKTVNAILIVNPRNPDGGYWTLSEIKPVIDWAVKEKNLYVILDEIYDLSVYDPIEEKPFESGIRLFDQDPTLDRNRLIWMSGLSKNFSLPGLRTAAMYTPNLEVLNATRRLLMLQGPNATTEFITREILGDIDWIKNIFLKENLKRLRECRDKTIQWLEKLKKETGKDIKWIHPRAGFFVMIDFTAFLEAKTFEAESKLQEKFIQNKIVIVPGKFLLMPIPGWFRIVFSGRPWPEIEKGFERIADVLRAIKPNLNDN